jgi:hypothetical protein
MRTGAAVRVPPPPVDARALAKQLHQIAQACANVIEQSRQMDEWLWESCPLRPDAATFFEDVRAA